MSAQTICWAVQTTQLRRRADEDAGRVCRSVLRRNLSLSISAAGLLASPRRPGVLFGNSGSCQVLFRQYAAQGPAGGRGPLPCIGMELAVYPSGPAAHGRPRRFTQRQVHHADAGRLCPANRLRGKSLRFCGRFSRKADALWPAVSAGALARPDCGDIRHTGKRRNDPR